MYASVISLCVENYTTPVFLCLKLNGMQHFRLMFEVSNTYTYLGKYHVRQEYIYTKRHHMNSHQTSIYL
jgi:hypothetical protein